jgi:antagonist of KipI
VPVGGAADKTSLAIGNALVGNPPETAALEFSLTGPTLEATCSLACVVYGAPFELSSKRQKLCTGRTFTLEPGEVLEVNGTHKGMRAYLCVAGGLHERSILDSRSSLEPVQAGMELRCLPGQIGHHFTQEKWHRQGEDRRVSARQCDREWWTWDYYPGGHLLRFLPGPQARCFVAGLGLDDQSGEYQGRAFQVHSASNRMGLRLQGPSIPFPYQEMLSEPVCPGAVQVTHNGQCIILGVDGQTIGGYPKIGQVISADLDMLGQLRPGESVYFQRVSLEEAERLYHARQAELQKWVMRLQTAVRGSTDYRVAPSLAEQSGFNIDMPEATGSSGISGQVYHS